MVLWSFTVVATCDDFRGDGGSALREVNAESMASPKSRRRNSADDPPRKATLDRYLEKRDPGRTNEPFAVLPRVPGETWQGSFVIHQHDATRMHYDLRLQIGGVLESFAVPKGITLDPVEKHLAMHTEEHPLDYLHFEAVIPDGNYGAGPMIVWDEGRVTFLDKSGEEGLREGKLDFVLAGYKAVGRYALIATGRRKKERNARGANASEWLLVKKPDSFAKPGPRLTEARPRSVESGLTVEELPRKDELVRDLLVRFREAGSRSLTAPSPFRAPMVAHVFEAPLTDPDYLYELKLDGARLVAHKDGGHVRLFYRSGREATGSFPELARALSLHPGDRFVLDGEVVHFDEGGRPNFSRMSTRFSAHRGPDVERARAEVPVVYLVFDLLEFEGEDLRGIPLRTRKTLLREVVRGDGRVVALSHIEERGDRLLAFCEEQGLEGIVAKRASSRYVHGPDKTLDWAKIKRAADDDFVVVGFTKGKGNRGALGALLLGSFEGTTLVYRGRVGSGFTDRELTRALESLLPHRTEESPLALAPEDVRDPTWLTPTLVARVRHHGFTPDGHLRAPVFEGFQPDRAPESCRAAPVDREDLLERETAARGQRTPSKPESSGATAPRIAGAERVVLSNLEKVFWPSEGFTKRDLLEYYANVAPALLPFLRDRPVVLVRYPDGIEGKNFYQWRAPDGTPTWIETLDLYDEEKRSERGTGKSVFVLNDLDSLLHVINLGCIPLHVLAARRQAPERCEFLTIDFDLGERPLADGVRLALGLGEILEDLRLVGYPKTSGQRGLHVLVPLGAGVPFEAAKILTELLGRLVVGRFPELSTMERRKEKRGDRVYVDTGQTGRSRTIVAPYSVRAYPGARVSTPLRFRELHLALDPGLFTIETVPARVESEGDLLADFFERTIELDAALRTLASWTGRG